MTDTTNGTQATNLATPLSLALVRDAAVYLAIPGQSGPVWARLAAGQETFDLSNNDDTQQYKFMDQGGYAQNEQTGRAPVVSVSGKRVFGDPAQEYVASIGFLLGNDLKTTALFQAVDDSGAVPVQISIYWGCTITNIIAAFPKLGGSANDNAPFSCDLALNGKPVVERTAYLNPLTVTSVAAGQGKTSITVSPPLGVGNSYVYQVGASVTLPTAGSTVETGSTWTTWNGVDTITATNGQEIGIVEINADDIAVGGGTATVVSGA